MAQLASEGGEQREHFVYLGLGSNQGDRDALLRSALAALAEQVTIERVSSLYDTAPLLVTDQPRFHNIVCSGRTRLNPRELLRFVKAIETRMGRVPGPRYGPRPIDIDILVYDQLELRTPELVVPHPGIAERAFVLAPLVEIAPALRVPGLAADVSALLTRVQEGDVRVVGLLSGQAG